jgi:tetratricopeptide (TPR) repeat protein
MFEAALNIDPVLAESHYQLGNLALQTGELGAAKEHLQAAEKNAPNDSRIHFAMSRLYRREGNSADAEREMAAFQKAKAK